VKYFLSAVLSASFCWGLPSIMVATGHGARSGPHGPFIAGPAFRGAGSVTGGRRLQDRAVPFHMWGPRTPTRGLLCRYAAYISVAPKIAAFAVLVRIGLDATGPGSDSITQAVLVMSDGQHDSEPSRRCGRPG